MHPDWMVDIPGGLAEEWHVMPRPEGQRCLVFAGKGVFYPGDGGAVWDNTTTGVTASRSQATRPTSTTT